MVAMYKEDVSCLYKGIVETARKTADTLIPQSLYSNRYPSVQTTRTVSSILLLKGYRLRVIFF